LTDQYAVEISDRAARDIKKLDRVAQTRVLKAIGLLRSHPRPSGARAITGHHGYLRVRVGDYRIVYTVDDERLTVLVVAAGHRREIYRGLP
jgi:mRNA interferase RelE/StbE